MIKALVVERTDSVREIIVSALNADPDITVVGHFDNAVSAIGFIRKSKPDIVLMDMELPKPTGIEATRIIMESTPVPIIILSSSTFTNTFETLEAGAVAVSERPVSRKMKNFDRIIERIIKTSKLMSEIKVVKRIPSGKNSPRPGKKTDNRIFQSKKKIKVIVIGASTGGPIILEQILSGLPKNFSIPILIVQHIASGFTEGLVKWLNSKSAIPVSMAESNVKFEQRHCYIAPEEFHLKIGNNGRLILSNEEPENNLKPSIDVLFRSAKSIFGKDALGVLLTGMGKDGAEGLKSMKEMGAVTIAQDKESSLIYGMPGEAAEIGAATHIFTPDEIIEFFINLSE